MKNDIRRGREGPDGLSLRAAVTSLLQSVLAARVALDRETAQLAELYQRHEILRQFQPPAFSLQDVTLRLPYASVDVEMGPGRDLKPGTPDDLPEMQVQVNSEILAKLPPHAIGVVELKLNQEMLSLLLGERKPE